jgi:hypothetical protein
VSGGGAEKGVEGGTKGSTKFEEPGAITIKVWKRHKFSKNHGNIPMQFLLERSYIFL